MLKKVAARIGVAFTAAALVGSVYAAIPAGSVSAEIPPQCTVEYPQIRTNTTVSAPYGVSARNADLITVKVLNTSNQDCYFPTVVITPREGTVFHSVVSTTGEWECDGPDVGEADETYCTNKTLPKYSSNTIRVRYDRLVPNGPVSGTASAELIVDRCPRSLEGDLNVCIY